MKLKYQFETMDMGNEICAVPVGDNADEFHGVLQLNEVATKMLQYIAVSETPEEVLDKLMQDYPDDDKNDIGQNLCDFLNQLIREGLLLP